MILEQCEEIEVNGKSMPQVSFPEGWELRLLGELATIFSGGTPNRKNPEYWDGDIPWITTTLIDGSDIFEANEFITQNGLKGSSAKWCKAGTILMAMYGQGKTRGKVALLGIDATINQACAAIELSELCSKEYVLHLLDSKYEQIRELSNSGGQENLSSGIIKRLEVLLPPKKEQIIIAKVLSDTNALITEFEQLIAKKKAIKTATVQQLLTGRTRLPQFAKHSDGTLKDYKSSELGLIPEDWQAVTLGYVTQKIVGGGTPSRANPNYWGNDIPWVTVKDFATFISTSAQEFITRNGLANSSSNLIPRGTLITSTRMALGKAVIYDVDVAINQDLKAVFTNEYTTALFLFYWFENNTRKFEELGSGSTVKGLSLNDLKGLDFLLMSIDEQIAITTILSDMDAELTVLEQKLAKIRDIKQGMMQQLLTGRIRLPLDRQP